MKSQAIICGQGFLKNSYQLNPFTTLGGYLGTQNGATDTTLGAWTKYYYQYNDLGTVMATTDDGGDEIGVYEPDAYGNYRSVDGIRPDSLGLTSKFYDADAGLYYFNARWYDPERGRWMSKEPTGADGPNLYAFVWNNPRGYVDMNGLTNWPWPGNGTVINASGKTICILTDGGYTSLPGGSSTGAGTDVDGFWLDGKFYGVLENANVHIFESGPAVPIEGFDPNMGPVIGSYEPMIPWNGDPDAPDSPYNRGTNSLAQPVSCSCQSWDIYE